MKRNMRFVLIVEVLALLALGVSIAAAQDPEPPRGEASTEGITGITVHGNLGTGFTYQGRLTRGGSPVTGVACNFQFSLWDALTGGTSLGTESLSVPVSNGLFTVVLNETDPFNARNAFTGDARWLAIRVQCPGDTGFITLSPRQKITATPYAFSLRPGAIISGILTTNGTPVLRADNTATSGTSDGIWGTTASRFGWGVLGRATAISGTTVGVLGDARAISGTTYGVYGVNSSPAGRGVYGINTYYSSSGFLGGGFPSQEFPTPIGVYGAAPGSGYAGYFAGNVHVTGNLSKGSGTFKIDHPLDPANKYLYHSFVESPDMMNVYNGNVTLDTNGEAWVQLPEWFEALNKDFRYQLTAVGAPGPNLYVAQEVQNNRFKIAGGQPGAKVSWQVTGIRHDPYAEAHRILVEEEKPAGEKGTYLHPVEWGIPEAMGLDYQRNRHLYDRLEAEPDGLVSPGEARP